MILLYFAWVRQKLGTNQETIAPPASVRTVHDLAVWLQTRGDAFADVFSDTRHLRAAVNQEHVGWDASVSANDEVAFFPPVTGG